MSNLHVDSVLKRYDNRQILTNIFVSCQKGEIIGLLGRNGSGKSTLLKIIFGSLPAERKFVKVGDQVISGLWGSHQHIKYLPQNSFLPNHIKVKQFIDLFCGQPNAEILKKHNLIHPLLNKKSKQLSGGERRILEISLILFSDSKYALIDEPFNGVAPVYKEVVKDMIREQSQTKGFIVTDHDYRNILEIATRIMILHDGGIRELKSRAELKHWGYLSE